MSVPARPAVRVVCVTYQPGTELTDFARSLADATTAPTTLVIVDNGPDHDAARAVAAAHGGQILEPGRNLGYGGAANLGARGGDEPWLVVANPDVVWHEGALDELLDAGERTGAGAVGPQLLNTDGTRYPSARALPSLSQGIGHALLGRLWPTNPWTRAYQHNQEGAGADAAERAADWLSGACLVVRRSAFEEVGGFDEGYFMFFEDLDLGERLGRAGWTNVHVPAAHVTHVGGTSWRARPERMIRAHHTSAVRYLSRRYHHWYQWPLRVALRLGLAVRQAAELRRAARGG
jgi:N-acetylglucosaminyl-diphospho-decaprenol L-rhamnosyltransferase